MGKADGFGYGDDSFGETAEERYNEWLFEQSEKFDDDTREDRLDETDEWRHDRG